MTGKGLLRSCIFFSAVLRSEQIDPLSGMSEDVFVNFLNCCGFCDRLRWVHSFQPVDLLQWFLSSWSAACLLPEELFERASPSAPADWNFENHQESPQILVVVHKWCFERCFFPVYRQYNICWTGEWWEEKQTGIFTGVVNVGSGDFYPLLCCPLSVSLKYLVAYWSILLAMSWIYRILV